MNKMIKAEDLAHLLGILSSVVSMALNNKPRVSESTRKLVLGKMVELGSLSPAYGYEPQTIDLVYFVIFKKHGKVVGSTPLLSQLTGDIEQSYRGNGYDFQIAYFNGRGNLPTTLSLIHSRECKGFPLLAMGMALIDASIFTSLKCSTVPLDNVFNGIALDTIVINNKQIAGYATKRLICSGHINIEYLHFVCHINNFSERKGGCRRELRRSGLHIPMKYEYKLAPTVDGAYSEMKEILGHDPIMPTALFADSDTTALSAMRVLKEKGYRIPEGIFIIGIDDIPICELMDSPPATMHVPKHQVGVQVIKRLLEKTNSDNREVLTVEIRTSLVER